MDERWPGIAQRVAQGLGVQAGELVLVRDHAGRIEVLQETLLAIEGMGATPLPEIVTAAYLGRLLGAAPERYLAEWDRHRAGWMRQADRVLVLQGEPLGMDVSGAPPHASKAWREAAGRLGVIEEERALPFLLVAVPTERQATALGMSLADLEAIVLPSLEIGAADLRQEIGLVLDAVRGERLTIHSGDDCQLHLTLGDRMWLDDDGEISDEDRARGGVVSNLPAGSVYTTVMEGEATGTLHLPQAEDATDVVLRFARGEVADITAATGAESLHALFARHSGDARRIGHIGIGLNPLLHRLLGWTLVDEHVRGCLFVSLGENRYMGGQNASSLNIDFALPNATLLVDGRTVIRGGHMALKAVSSS
jgi:leucyl aminopeptidase (aminopeptidase T)